MRKEIRVVSLARETPSIFFALPNIIKIFQTLRGNDGQEFGLEMRSGEITRKRRKHELSFLHAPLLLDLIYVLVIFFKQLWPVKGFGIRGDKYIKRK